jgi:hypothetical protein
MNAMIVENGYAEIATPNRRFWTTRLGKDCYVRIDDGKQYSQLCVGAARTGNTLTYRTDAQLARDCKARLYKTRKGFEAAAAKLAQS